MPPPNVTIAKQDGTVLISGLSPQEFDYFPGGEYAEESFLCTSNNGVGRLSDTVTIYVVGKDLKGKLIRIASVNGFLSSCPIKCNHYTVPANGRH